MEGPTPLWGLRNKKTLNEHDDGDDDDDDEYTLCLERSNGVTFPSPCNRAIYAD